MRRRALAAGLFALLAAADAGAQFGGGGMGGVGGMGGMGRRGGTRGGDRSKSGDTKESVDTLQVTLEELRTDLKLTAEQQPRWDAYREKVEAFAGDLARERQRQRSASAGEKLDAPQQLNRLVDTQRNHLAAMEDIAQAGGALYSTLTEQQKQVADARLANVARRAGGDSQSVAARDTLPSLR